MIEAAATTVQQNTLVNQVDVTGLPKRIVSAIKDAANKTGVDFTYLLKKASQESSFDPNAQASSSSAVGLYQFTQQTWLQMMKNYGGKYGQGTTADHIQIDSSGVAHVSDPSWKKTILNMRKDPIISAEMAGELDKQNQTALQDNVGGKVGGTELYLAHFLGAGGATDFLNEMRNNPKQSAANVLPEAAAANPNVFYGKDGTAKSLKQIYQHFADKFDNVSGAMQVASTGKAATHSYAVASAATTTSPITTAAGSSIYNTMSFSVNKQAVASLTSNTNSLQAEGSSYFATMLLAQMHDHPASFSADKTEDKDKKTAADLLSNFASA